MSTTTNDLNELAGERGAANPERLLRQRSIAFLLDYIATLIILATVLVLAIYLKRHWPVFRVGQVLPVPGFMAAGARLLLNSGFLDLEGARLAGLVSSLGYLATAGWIFYNWVYVYANDRQSLGKYFVGLRVRRLDGARVGYGTAIRRHLVGYPLTILTLGLGLLPVFRDGRQRGWHDRLAGTTVETVAETMARIDEQ